MGKCLLLFLLFISCNIDYSKKEKLQNKKIIKQENNKISFEYKKLHQKPTLKYKKIDSIFDYKNKIKKIETENYITDFCDFDITHKIRFHQNGVFFIKNNKKTNFPDITRAYFLFDGKQIFVEDYLIPKDTLSSIKGYAPRVYHLKNAYKIEIGQKKFIAVYINNLLSNFTNFNMMIFLFDITSQTASLILAEKQGSSNVDCFGDWNDDGNLDYFHKIGRMETTEKIYVKSLKNNIWVTDSTKYIFLEGNFHQQIIHIKKSKWYFGLK